MNEASVGRSWLVSAWWPTLTPACTARIEMYRANTCAVVRNSSIDAPGATTSESAAAALRLSSTKLEWVSMLPLGMPVDPDV